MTKLDPAKLADTEALPYRKSKDKSGKGAKTPCPGNLEGNGAHMYEVIKENILIPSGETHTYHHKECIACGKRSAMKSWNYTGDFYEERNVRYVRWTVNGPVYERIS